MDDPAFGPQDHPQDDPGRASSASTLWVLIGLVLLVGGGFLAYHLLKRELGPAPRDIAGDPLLVTGRELYLKRCVGCHGEQGYGDGPLAATLSGPPPGDLTDDEWKHGDAPEEVLDVLRKGVPGTGMSGWRVVMSEEQLHALAAYVYHLAGRDVPVALRTPVTEAGATTMLGD